ncbi:hypothetical protein VCR17J2_870076 [Vibrio coralliirubri]|nr:hypothetical protein VCR17J2_870076 [Vibrio coralliirubri]
MTKAVLTFHSRKAKINPDLADTKQLHGLAIGIEYFATSNINKVEGRRGSK